MNIKVFNDEEKNKTFNKKGTELVIKTQGKFRVEEDKKRMDICLRGLIYESELVDFLKSINITNFTIRNLEEYIKRFESDIDTNNLKLTLDLYKMLHS